MNEELLKWTVELRRESEREIRRGKEWIKNSVRRGGGGRFSGRGKTVNGEHNTGVFSVTAVCVCASYECCFCHWQTAVSLSRSFALSLARLLSLSLQKK